MSGAEDQTFCVVALVSKKIWKKKKAEEPWRTLCPAQAYKFLVAVWLLVQHYIYPLACGKY